MQIVLAPTTGLSLDGSLFNPARAAGNWHYSDASQNCTDDQFVAMLNADRGSGGLVREENVLAMFSRRCRLDADTLANWIAEREVIGFDWQSRTWPKAAHQTGYGNKKAAGLNSFQLQGGSVHRLPHRQVAHLAVRQRFGAQQLERIAFGQ